MIMMNKNFCEYSILKRSILTSFPYQSLVFNNKYNKSFRTRVLTDNEVFLPSKSIGYIKHVKIIIGYKK